MKYLLYASLASLALANPNKGPKPKKVDPHKFPNDIKLDALLAGSQKLQDMAYAYPERNRVFGGVAHNETVDWLYEELKATGFYDVWKQPQVHQWTTADQTLTVSGEDLEAQTMTYSPSVKVEAELAVIPNVGCDKADYAGVSGKIALVQRGTCPFADKSVLAAAADAAAVVVYNNEGGPMSGTLGGSVDPRGKYAAIVGISKEDGATLTTKLKDGAVKASLVVDSKVEDRMTFNVIAQTKTGDPNNVVALGGHTDSVDAGPGINDDGSGIVSNLVIAKALTKYKVKNAVRFCFWTAEEFGLLGSTFYVESLNATEIAKIRLYLNMDMIASPNYALMIYDGDGSSFDMSGPPGSAEIEHLFEHYYGKIANKKFMATAFDGRSDYQAFIENGIPAGGLFTGAEGIKTEEEAEQFGGEAGVAYDENYHAKGDTMDNINSDAYLLNSKATAYAVATYAENLETIPPRNASSVHHFTHKRGYKGRPHTRRVPKTNAHVHGTGCMHSRVEA
ncbi:M28 family metallopeptidase [Aspergillus candidus]|uniref:Peptide hydrolase n=1 Tax=Aspergillus candidus TaxID=41067 RepID=A0A2I2F2R3_ASPCN|nr:transferrin receptor [Aspergillus candidus]PLB34907.1 transferrin receptor [Aspergillus candidus]